MRIQLKHSAFTVIGSVLAAAIEPRPAMPPSVWAAENLVVPDGPHAGEKFNPELTPYLIEPLDFWADDCPENKDVFRKSKQIGASTMAIGAIGYTIDVEPCDVMLIEPTDSNLTDFNGEKLQRSLEASPQLKEKVFAQTSRSGKGSTTYSKRFRGGSILMGIATSTADLRGKTRKKVIKDEASEYPHDLDGQGSPHDMIAGAYEAFLAAGDWKEMDISTPVIKGACYIDAEFEAGDQRFWHMDCPGCAKPFYFQFKPQRTFRFSETFPHQAHYVTECCGTIIEAHEKNSLVRKGSVAAPPLLAAEFFKQRGITVNNGWIATAAGPGKHRSRHFDALSSPFVPWDTIAARFLAAKDDPAKLKTFDTLTLGLAHEVKGDAPDYVRLMERREDYPEGMIPPAGLLLVAGADVQHNGIWVEVVAFGADQQSWSVVHRFLEGDTTDPEGGAFTALTALFDQSFPDAFGSSRTIDALAVDAGDGGRLSQVCTWTRGRARAFAIKGMPGWTTPAIGTPTKIDINRRGRKIKGGATLWPVGTWSLKATYYANLRKDGRKAGAEIDPPGYCHHHLGCDERYFKQQTAAYLKTATFRGRSTRVWQESGPDHLLDCRVYAMAMADYLGLTRLTQEQWKEVARQRGVPIVLKEPDLLAPDSVKIAARMPALPESKSNAPTTIRSNWMDR